MKYLRDIEFYFAIVVIAIICSAISSLIDMAVAAPTPTPSPTGFTFTATEGSFANLTTPATIAIPITECVGVKIYYVKPFTRAQRVTMRYAWLMQGEAYCIINMQNGDCKTCTPIKYERRGI